MSKTHVYRFVTKLPGNTNVNYRKALEGMLFARYIFFIWDTEKSSIGRNSLIKIFFSS